MRHFALTALTLLMVTLLWALPAIAQTSGTENMAREDARASAERQARAEIESLLARLCPGRCELVDINVVVDEPRAQGSVTPGFEGASGARFEAEVRRIEATVLMDSNLPENFQANIPRMAQFRLQNLAPTIEVRPEILEFPSPQLPPTPEGLPQRQPEPAPPLPEPVPEPEPVEEPQPEAQPQEEPASAETPFWQEALPWIALLLTLLILGGLIILILRRLEAISSASDDTKMAGEPDTDSSDVATMPDVDALRDDLKESRPVLNRMLRRWLEEDPEQVALLVHLVGPGILSDIRRDPDLRPTLEVVSDHVGGLDGAVDAEKAQSIAQKARSRYDAQLVVDDSVGDAEWDFLEGLTLGQVSKLLQSASRRERGFVLTRLSPVIRSRYLEGLKSGQRRELLLEASSTESLSRSESRELAARLRQIADEFTDAAREAAGQAAMIVEMVEAMKLGEQQEVLGDMLDNRPDVANVVLSRLCLESALPIIPTEALADAVHRLPVETLTTFLQGTREDIANHVLETSPASKRQAVSTELSLEIPTTRADFLDARQQLSKTVLETLRRNGYDPTQFNADALRATSPPSHSEVAE